MTRFLGCGTDTSDFQMHAIINEGEHQQNLLSFKKQQDHFRQKAMDPANDVFRPDGELASMTELKTKIVEKLTLVAEALNDVQNFGSKQTTAILKSLTNV